MLSLSETFQLSEKVILRRLIGELHDYGYRKIMQNKKFVYAKGDIPIMLVAHLDTVHKNLPEKIYWDKNQDVYWSPQGLGADDRAGVWGILTLLNMGFRPHVLFTTGEEVGGIGARAAVKHMKIPKVKFIIELDRQGSKDAVFYDCDNPAFTKYIEGFGFVEEWGSFSDISILCPTWKIAGVNLSTGYYLAHTVSEYLDMGELQITVAKVANMLMNVPSNSFEYIEGYNSYSFYYRKYASNKAVVYSYFYCDVCGKKVDLKEESPEIGYCNTCYERIMGKIADN